MSLGIYFKMLFYEINHLVLSDDVFYLLNLGTHLIKKTVW